MTVRNYADGSSAGLSNADVAMREVDGVEYMMMNADEYYPSFNRPEYYPSFNRSSWIHLSTVLPPSLRTDRAFLFPRILL